MTRRHLKLLGVLILALSVTAALAVGDAGAKKKKKKRKAGGTVDVTKVVAAPVPDATASIDGTLASTIDVAGKQFNGTRIRDVNVTVATTGSSGPPTPSAAQLTARLTAPNGATTWLFSGFFGSISGQSILGLTIDDESPNRLTGGNPRDATELGPPYLGTAQPDPFSSFGNVSLSVMDDGPVVGTWTLRVYDFNPAGPSTSVLNSWRLVVLAGKAYRTK